jgi:hypothetical protein
MRSAQHGAPPEPRAPSDAEGAKENHMSNLVGALIGAAIDRQDGDSGIKGAIVGGVAQSAIRVVAPILVTYALGWAVQYGVRKAWHAAAGRDPIDREGELRAAQA